MEQDKALQKAKNNAFSLLRARPRSEAEMRSRLMLKKHDGPTVDAVIGYLKKVGQIDDAKFAALWVESKMRANPVGEKVLRLELKEKGVAEHVIEAVLEERSRNYDEYELARSMALERIGILGKIDRRKALKRLYDYLLRMGFDYDIVKRVIDTVIDES